MSDGAIAASIIVYLLGLIGILALVDFVGLDHEPWQIATALLWPLAVPLGIQLAGVAGVIDLIVRILFGYRWLEDLGRRR